MCTCLCMCICICVDVFEYVCVVVFVWKSVYVYFSCIYICMCSCLYMYICIYVYVFICMSVCFHAFICMPVSVSQNACVPKQINRLFLHAFSRNSNSFSRNQRHSLQNIVINWTTSLVRYAAGRAACCCTERKAAFSGNLDTVHPGFVSEIFLHLYRIKYAKPDFWKYDNKAPFKKICIYIVI